MSSNNRNANNSNSNNATGSDMMTGKHLIVADKGFIFVGNTAWKEHPILGAFLHVTECVNVRKWETGGFGGITAGAKSADATLDACRPQCIPKHAVVSLIQLADSWEND
jgi:hypothetical protein